MRRIILMLLFAVPLIAQVRLEQPGAAHNKIIGDVTYDYIHAVGSADSQSVALTVTQNVYKKNGYYRDGVA